MTDFEKISPFSANSRIYEPCDQSGSGVGRGLNLPRLRTNVYPSRKLNDSKVIHSPGSHSLSPISQVLADTPASEKKWGLRAVVAKRMYPKSTDDSKSIEGDERFPRVGLRQDDRTLGPKRRANLGIRRIPRFGEGDDCMQQCQFSTSSKGEWGRRYSYEPATTHELSSQPKEFKNEPGVPGLHRAHTVATYGKNDRVNHPNMTLQSSSHIDNTYIRNSLKNDTLSHYDDATTVQGQMPSDVPYPLADLCGTPNTVSSAVIAEACPTPEIFGVESSPTPCSCQPESEDHSRQQECNRLSIRAPKYAPLSKHSSFSSQTSVQSAQNPRSMADSGRGESSLNSTREISQKKGMARSATYTPVPLYTPSTSSRLVTTSYKAEHPNRNVQ